jgi:hypothetical protein
MNKIQLEAKSKIEEQMKQFHKAFVSGSLPSDKEIMQFANLFYVRDKDYQIGTDVEMLAVARGIVQGMQMLRTVVEGNDC